MMALPFAATDDSKKRHYANLEAIARLEGYFLAIERNAESAKQALQDDAEIVEE
jgi:hypothetical protein